MCLHGVKDSKKNAKYEFFKEDDIDRDMSLAKNDIDRDISLSKNEIDRDLSQAKKYLCL